MIEPASLDRSALYKSLAVHVIVMCLFLVSWNWFSDDQIVKMPAHVKAMVISKGDQADRAARKAKPVDKPKPPEPKPEPKPPEPKPPEPKPEPPKPEPKPTKPEPKPVPKPDTKPLPKEPVKQPDTKQKPPDKVKPKKTDFSDLLDDVPPLPPTTSKAAPSESAASNASTSPDVDPYMAGIRSAIERRWVRPPSAVNGLKVMLRIFLMPGGEVNDVQVTQTSGDPAFDRSAVAAVKKAARFEVPEDPVEFDKRFRQFSVLFNPDDLLN